jgi:hypothetical protein
VQHPVADQPRVPERHAGHREMPSGDAEHEVGIAAPPRDWALGDLDPTAA